LTRGESFKFDQNLLDYLSEQEHQAQKYKFKQDISGI
jgi:hypothetical protein